MAPTLAGEVVSLQVGLPAPLPWRGREVASAIVKRPVNGAVALGPEGFDGDAQADRSVHGGPDKAVCCYPVEHQAGLAARIGAPLPPGAFGENLTLRGLTEDLVHVGDVFAIGTAEVQVSQPRGPCYKLAARWDLKELPAILARGGMTGFYFRVLRPGAVAAGDEVLLLERRSAVTVADVLRVTYTDRRDAEGIAAAMAADGLAAGWRATLEAMLRRSLPPVTSFGGED